MTEDVENTAAETEELGELETLRQERDELLDTLQRVQAEFENYRKRVARDQESLVTRAHERLVKELLPVLDDLERALEAAEAHEEAKLEEGVALVARSFAELLRKEGPRGGPDGREVRPARPRGAALAAVRGRGGHASSRCSRRATGSATG